MNHKALYNLLHIDFEGRRPLPVRSFTRAREARASGLSRPQVERQRVWVNDASAERDAFLAWMLGRAGLDPGLYRLEPLLRRLPACLRALKVASQEEARLALAARPELLMAALRALLIGVTGFFRDSAVFECLADEVLPELARRDGPLRIWSLACSSGAELYSVAILLAEAGLLERGVLLGTDCRADAIAQAQSGLFCEDALHGMDPALRARYFRAQGKYWRIELPHRPDGIAWRTANLDDRLEPGPWDLILFRNAAIYMTSQAAQRIWGELACALRLGGVLVAGKAERPASESLVLIKRCIYRKSGVGESTHG